jgi:hypothetical protein
VRLAMEAGEESHRALAAGEEGLGCSLRESSELACEEMVENFRGSATNMEALWGVYSAVAYFYLQAEEDSLRKKAAAVPSSLQGHEAGLDRKKTSSHSEHLEEAEVGLHTKVVDHHSSLAGLQGHEGGLAGLHDERKEDCYRSRTNIPSCLRHGV